MNPYHVLEHRMPQEACDYIRDHFLKSEWLPSEVGRDGEDVTDEKVRNNVIKWTDSQEIKDLLYYYAVEANGHMWNFDITDIETPQFSLYREDKTYDWHPDRTFTEHVNRKLTVALLLNNDFTGGDFEIYPLQGPDTTTVITATELKDTVGTAIVFPSMLWHRVTPVLSGSRMSLVGWVTGPEFK
jgi:PKHD-type hydroxylase